MPSPQRGFETVTIPGGSPAEEELEDTITGGATLEGKFGIPVGTELGLLGGGTGISFGPGRAYVMEPALEGLP